MAHREGNEQPDVLLKDLRWNLLFVPPAVSAPILRSPLPLAGRTGIELWEVVQHLVPVLFLRGAGLLFVGLGVLACSDWLLPPDTRDWGYAAAITIMMWTAGQLLWLGVTAGILKRSKYRDRPLTGDNWAYKAILVAPIAGLFAAITIGVAFR